MRKVRLVIVFLLTIICFTIDAQQFDGKASFYSNNLHGSKMANGRRYNRNALTCAHKTLPFGTMLRVTNMNNGQEVIVEVTDRGPYVKGRVIDLSYQAAKELGMIGAGVSRVQIEILPPGATVPYRTDEDNPLELPEGVEYGMAGVCYEYIPDWEKPKAEELHTVPRKIKTTTRQNKHSSTPKNRPAKSNVTHKPAVKVSQQKQQRHQPKKQQNNNSWSNFFTSVKNGVTSLFD